MNLKQIGKESSKICKSEIIINKDANSCQGGFKKIPKISFIELKKKHKIGIEKGVNLCK